MEFYLNLFKLIRGKRKIKFSNLYSYNKENFIPLRVLKSKLNLFAEPYNIEDVQFEKTMFCSHYTLSVIIQATVKTYRHFNGVASTSTLDMSFFGFNPSTRSDEVSPSLLKEAFLKQEIIRPLNPNKHIPFEIFVQ